MSTVLEDTPLKIEGSMAFEIKGSDLKQLISGVSLSYPTQTIMSVTRHIVLEADPGGDDPASLRLISTNLSSFSSVSTDKVSVTDGGRIGLYGAQLLKMRSQIADDEPVHVSVHDSVATFRSGGATWGFRLNDITRFPEFPALAQGPWNIDRDLFIEAVGSVSRAAASDHVRQNMMLIDVADQTMRASDGARYQQVYTPWWPKDLEVAIPVSAIPRLIQFFKRADLGAVAFYQSDQYLGFVITGATYVIARPGAKFAMMDDLLLKPALANCSLKFKCKLGDFSTALSRLSALGDPSGVVRIDMQTNHFDVWSEDRAGNSASATVDLIESDVPKGSQYVFNHKHLTDLLAMSGEEEGTFYVGQDKKTKKTPLLYRGPERGVLGVVNQTRLT